MVNQTSYPLYMFQEDLLIHGDSVYDMIDKQDHQAVSNELVKSTPTHGDDDRLFLCRMNVSRNARRQMRFGDQKVRTYTIYKLYRYTTFFCIERIF